jgi:hypothetical protein
MPIASDGDGRLRPGSPLRHGFFNVRPHTLAAPLSNCSLNLVGAIGVAAAGRLQAVKLLQHGSSGCQKPLAGLLVLGIRNLARLVVKVERPNLRDNRLLLGLQLLALAPGHPDRRCGREEEGSGDKEADEEKEGKAQ